MALQYEVHFLGDQHVEQVRSNVTRLCTGRDADLVHSNHDPFYSSCPRAINRTSSPVVVGIVLVVRPTSRCIVAGAFGDRIARCRAHTCDVKDSRRDHDEPRDRVDAGVIEVVLLAITLTSDGAANNLRR